MCHLIVYERILLDGQVHSATHWPCSEKVESITPPWGDGRLLRRSLPFLPPLLVHIGVWNEADSRRRFTTRRENRSY